MFSDLRLTQTARCVFRCWPRSLSHSPCPVKTWIHCVLSFHSAAPADTNEEESTLWEMMNGVQVLFSVSLCLPFASWPELRPACSPQGYKMDTGCFIRATLPFKVTSTPNISCWKTWTFDAFCDKEKVVCCEYVFGSSSHDADSCSNAVITYCGGIPPDLTASTRYHLLHKHSDSNI